MYICMKEKDLMDIKDLIIYNYISYTSYTNIYYILLYII